jgi:DNA polymerase
MISNSQIDEASSMEEIAELVSKCTRCDLYKAAKNPVPGCCNTKAEIVFIGEGPGKNEDEQGKPFVGAAGKLLTEMLEENGFKREDVFITNVVKHRPPNNRDPLESEVEACFPYLRRQLQLINPKLIVFLGRHSLNRFFPELKISEVHGKAFRKEISYLHKKQVFLALFHPAAALYRGSMKETLKADFAKLPKLIEKITKETNESNNQNLNQPPLF